MSDVLDAAMAWASAGFCVLPLKAKSKAPAVATWTQYVRAKGSVSIPAAPSPQIVERWFTAEQHGLGLVLGATSNSAEMFEFEGRATHLLGEFRSLAEANGAGEIWTRLQNGYVERTPSGGLHFVFRVAGTPLGNTALARRPSTAEELEANPQQLTQVLLETRGEGGFVVVAPSVLAGHGHWAVTRGTAGVVVTLSEAERDLLYAVAGMLNEIPEPEPKPAPGVAHAPRAGREGGPSAFDDFRARTEWSAILPEHGWSYVTSKHGRDYWLRPGKSSLDEGWDHSASTGNGDGDHLWVWSTSAGLPTEETLSKEFVWAHYNHGGDLHEAAAALREAGYGDQGSAQEYRASLVVPGCLDPFDDGFDPVAWAGARALNNRGAAGAVPTVGPVNPGQDGSPSRDEEFRALDWELLENEEYVEEWVVAGLLGARRSMALYSAPKLGKSLLMLEMAARVSRGEPFLGRATRRTTVLYFDHENDPRSDTWPRLRAMGFAAKDLGDLKVLSFPNMAALDTEAGGIELMRAVAQFDAGLVIIDTVSRTIAGEENDNNTWLKFFDWTGKVLKRAEIPYVRLDHSGKDETKGQRGGSAKSGDVDIICQLVNTGNQRFALRMDGSRQRLSEDAISFIRLDEPLRSVPATTVERDRENEAFDALTKKRAAFTDKMIAKLVVPGTELTERQIKNAASKHKEDAEVVNWCFARLHETTQIRLKYDGKSSIYELNPEWSQGLFLGDYAP